MIKRGMSKTETWVVVILVALLFHQAVFGFLTIHDYRSQFIGNLHYIYWIFVFVIALRLNIAHIMKTFHKKWNAYFVLWISSPFWILLVSRIEIAYYDKTRFLPEDFPKPFLGLIASILCGIFITRLLGKRKSKAETQKSAKS
jgi:hypothetical protein